MRDTRISQVLEILVKRFDEVGAWNLEWTNPMTSKIQVRNINTCYLFWPSALWLVQSTTLFRCCLICSVLKEGEAVLSDFLWDDLPMREGFGLVQALVKNLIGVDKSSWGTQGGYMKKVVHIETKFELLVNVLVISCCISLKYY